MYGDRYDSSGYSNYKPATTPTTMLLTFSTFILIYIYKSIDMFTAGAFLLPLLCIFHTMTPAVPCFPSEFLFI